MIKKIICTVFCMIIVLSSLTTKISAEPEKRIENKCPITNSALRSGKLNNIVVYARFKGEEEFLNSNYRDKTIKNVFSDMYNNANVSVKNYYSKLSQGILNLESIFIGANNECTESVELNHEREYYLPMSENNLIGYPKYTVVNSDTYEFIASMYYSESGKKDIDPSDGIVTEHYLDENPNVTFLENDVNRNYREFSLVYEVIEKIEKSSLKDVNLDRNKDEFMDSMTIILGVTPENRIMDQIQWNELIWPHQHTLPYYYDEYSIEYDKKTHNVDNSYLNNEICEINKTRVGRYNISTSDFMLNEECYVESDVGEIGDIGTISHELGHVLGLPDLYTYDDTSSMSVGMWDLMAEHNIVPQYINSYMRKKAGWLNINQIPEVVQDGEYELKPIGAVGKDDIAAYMIKVPKEEGQFIVIEYRKSIGEFDGAIINKYGWKGPNIEESGLILYRIDTRYDYGSEDYIMNGNAYGEPYNIYIFRDEDNDYYFNKSSAINGVNENSYGNIDKNKIKNTLTVYDEYTNELKNSGILINNIRIVNDKMKFAIDIKEPEASIELITKNEILIAFDEEVEIVDESKITLMKNGLNENINIKLKEGNKLYISLSNLESIDKYILNIGCNAIKDLAGRTMISDLTKEINVIDVNSIDIDNKELFLDVNESAVLTAIIKPKDAIDKSVIWSSDNEQIATVDEVGRVTGINNGKTVVTATTNDGNKTVQCIVTVKGNNIEKANSEKKHIDNEKIVVIVVSILILIIIYKINKKK